MPPQPGNKSPGKELGLSGLNFTSQGYIDEEFLPNLRGRQAIKVYREMSHNDPVVFAVLIAITLLTRQVEWSVEEQPDGNEEDTKFLEECMDDMSHSWSDFVSEIMSMITYGFSFFEIVYKARNGQDGKGSQSKFTDGRVGWRKFAFRSQDSLDRWQFDDQGGIQGFVQKPPPAYEDITIPIEKGLLFRTTTFKNNPEGQSALRGAYRPWYYKKRIEEIEGVGIERDLAGLPFAEVDASILADNAGTNEKAILASIQRIITNVRQDKEAGIIWPLIYDENGNKMFEFRLLNSGGSRTFDTSAIIQRYDQRIAQTVLADFILLGHERVGSFALSSDKTDIFAVAIGAWLDSVEDTINRFAVPRLFELNGIKPDVMPRIKHGDIEKPNLQEISNYIASLAGTGMGIFPDPPTEKWLRTIAGMPEPSEESEKAFEQNDQQKLQEAMSGLQGMAGQMGDQGAPPAGGPQEAPQDALSGQGNVIALPPSQRRGAFGNGA